MIARIVFLSLFWLACESLPAPRDIGENHVPGRLEFVAFTLKAPPGWKKFNTKEEDERVGLTDGKGSLFVTDLWTHYKMSFGSDRLCVADTVDGYVATVTIPKNRRCGLVEMGIGDDELRQYHIMGTASDISVALAIFESIHFPEGDPTRTAALSPDRFHPGTVPDPFDGRQLFDQHCAACHAKYRQIIGPALTPEYVKEKGEKWLVDYLSREANRSKRGTGPYCIRAPELNKQQIMSIVRYLNAVEKRYAMPAVARK